MDPIGNWRRRHQDPTNFWLHMVGISATIVAIPLAIVGYWEIAVAMFAAGYALQFLGHAIEGNRSGEGQLLRRLLRLDKADKSNRPAGRTGRRRNRARGRKTG